MAFDGITVAALAYECDTLFKNGYIQKITQPETDEIVLSIKRDIKQIPDHKDDLSYIERAYDRELTLKLKLSANASLPLFYITDENKPSPFSAPNFCMLLRKHLLGSRIISISQVGFERVLRIMISGRNELGDDVSHSLMVEVMGKHSNIIFIDDDDNIIDSIKHVNGLVSSVREVLPGRKYFIPNTLNKLDPLSVTNDVWLKKVFINTKSIADTLAATFTGISKIMAYELCHRAHIDSDVSANSLNGNARSALMHTFRELIDDIRSCAYEPHVYLSDSLPMEYAAFPLLMYEDDMIIQKYTSMSKALYFFYTEKERLVRIKHKSADLKKTIQTHMERCQKKLALQKKQMDDTKKRDKYKVYGELINTYGYQLKDGEKSLTCINYYDDKEITIPIDPTLSPSDNANHYFDRYNKLKRTYEALKDQIKDNEAALSHLESVMTALSISRYEEDLLEIRRELYEAGYIKNDPDKKAGKKKGRITKSDPLHFISSDGYDIYVGKNNYQNEEITFKIATGNDWWFHAKQMPGSHVVVKSNDKELPDTTFEEAASLAAYFSKGRDADKVEIDYIQKKHVKKPKGAHPGFVIYYTNYSMMASTDIHDIHCVNEADRIFL